MQGKLAAAAAKSLQSCPTLCDPIDGSQPGSPVPGILQPRTLEWLPFSSQLSGAKSGPLVHLKELQVATSCITPRYSAITMREWDSTGSQFWELSFTFGGKGNDNPLQCSCLENPRDEGAWWTAFYGVTQSRTRLKRLSSSSNNIILVVQNLLILLKIFPKRVDIAQLSKIYPLSLNNQYDIL